MNSDAARLAALYAFDEIMPVSFAEFDACIDHAYSRQKRYVSEDISDEFSAFFA